MLTEAYSCRDLQMFGQLLDMAAAAGKDIVLLRAEVSAAQASVLASIPEVRQAPRPPDGGGFQPCPSTRPDGSSCPGRLVPARNSEGLTIYGCPICRYSEVR